MKANFKKCRLRCDDGQNLDPCGEKWQGIKCENCTVTSLVLERTNLTGLVPADMHLPNLNTLRLSLNNLHGPLPPLYSISKLTSLYLHGNSFNGSLPASYSQLAATMTHLRLYDNKLAGTLPNYLGQFTNMELLRLKNNLFTGMHSIFL